MRDAIVCLAIVADALLALFFAFLFLAERSMRRDAEACEADVRNVCNRVRLGLPMDRQELQLARHLLGDAALRDWRERQTGGVK